MTLTFNSLARGMETARFNVREKQALKGAAAAYLKAM